MSRRIRAISAIILLGTVAMATSCSEPEENTVVGNWRPIERFRTGWDDFSYNANWTINKDGTYYLEFHKTGIWGGIDGYSSGTYVMLSESLMVYTSIEHENIAFNSVFNAITDSIFIELFDSQLITAGVGMVITWERP
ncbi:MAG: hypothetical protein IIA59_09665 [Candidatus Marinimicrobia bacterium]|nr:hypothetical protein [Candidatus Neomarinimicrobiota bacterium]